MINIVYSWENSHYRLQILGKTIEKEGQKSTIPGGNDILWVWS